MEKTKVSVYVTVQDKEQKQTVKLDWHVLATQRSLDLFWQIM